ncbi:sulfate ABC transporter permease subunit CysT [Petroclostridium sp. X23]|uniref:sulfate ABC transporter permease subunit CysT n=1 Tax=Petroclostridium sp. X23 TaxID=3045146 RepID=UPI0024AD4E2F|nr:sulfate ABC transporter permease subunit CysT [Petroclostridium sp. X23]WHH57501.1 sulfate ABC transporter permease subunit CysT [Petroclostridium sp. X23]
MYLSLKPFMIKQKSIIPGFGLTMGFTIFYLSFLTVIPVSMVFINSSTMGWSRFWSIVTAERVLASYRVTFSAAFMAAAVNAVFGLLVAWVLVRYPFKGHKIIDGLVDLPFALPTAVAGISLTTLYAQNGWMGRYLALFGIKAAYTSLGIIIALVFVGLPFVVRTVQPVLIGLEQEVEEAAASLGATRLTIFFKIILPEILPALLTGFALAFARSLGEYGSVVFISGNMPMKTEITPLLILTKLEQYDYSGATAIAAVMLMISFFMLLTINILQWWSFDRNRG